MNNINDISNTCIINIKVFHKVFLIALVLLSSALLAGEYAIAGTAIKYKKISVPKHSYSERGGQKPSIIHIFYTGESEEDALKTFKDPKEKASAHYLISADGKTIYQLVPEKFSAWHAGESYWNGITAVNENAIGIALVNKGITDEEAKSKGWKANFPPYAPEQLQALKRLSQDIIKHWDIKPWNIVGHSDIAPQRKFDPGLKFSWESLAKNGIGLWPQPAQRVKSDPINTEDFLKKLAQYGYQVPNFNSSLKSEDELQEDPAVKRLVSSFQAHFRPWKVDGIVDAESNEILDKLLQLKDLQNES